MERYRVVRIEEQMYGCEELPEGAEVCCDVTVEAADGTRKTLSCPDAALIRQASAPSGSSSQPYICSSMRRTRQRSICSTSCPAPARGVFLYYTPGGPARQPQLDTSAAGLIK